jgi:hypothetical protein
MKTKYTISLIAAVAVLTPLAFGDFITSKEQEIFPTRSIAADFQPDPECLAAVKRGEADPSDCEEAVESDNVQTVQAQKDEAQEDEAQQGEEVAQTASFQNLREPTSPEEFHDDVNQVCTDEVGICHIQEEEIQSIDNSVDAAAEDVVVQEDTEEIAQSIVAETSDQEVAADEVTEVAADEVTEEVKEEVKEDDVAEVAADEVTEEVKEEVKEETEKEEDDEVEEYADKDTSDYDARINELQQIACQQNEQIDVLTSSISTLQNNMQQSFMMLMMSQMFGQNNSQPSYERSFQGAFNQTGFLQGLMYGQQIMSLSNIMNPYQYSGLMGGSQGTQNIYNVTGDYYGSYNHLNNRAQPMPYMNNQVAPYSFQFGNNSNSANSIEWMNSGVAL